jgi:bifunctional NMN adenylyltransferase/nudix hydrolase
MSDPIETSNLPQKPDLDAIGIVVGRFQIHALHPGHLHLLDTVLQYHATAIVLLGVRPGNPTRRNPLNFEARKKMLLATYGDRIQVVPLMDHAEDHVWDALLDQQILEHAPHGKVVLYGSRDSFVLGYKGQFPTQYIETPLPGYNATEFRTSILEEPMDTPDFRAGMIYAVSQRHPAVYPTVDIAIFNAEKTQLLLGKKPNETRYRFPGGFVDPTDPDFEAAARREAVEECGPIELSAMQYIGSRQVDDWRYQRTEDRICTTLFACTLQNGMPVASDDLAELRWFSIAEITQNDLIPGHWNLFKMLLNQI